MTAGVQSTTQPMFIPRPPPRDKPQTKSLADILSSEDLKVTLIIPSPPPSKELLFSELTTKEKVAKIAAYALAILGGLALLGALVILTGGLGGLFAITAITIASTVLQPLAITCLTASVYFFSISSGKEAEKPSVTIAGLKIGPK